MGKRRERENFRSHFQTKILSEVKEVSSFVARVEVSIKVLKK
jgi:hypothetical protein